MANYSGAYTPRPKCAETRVYNEEHYAKHKDECYKSHDLYFWEGVKDNRATLIADSVFKWVREVMHLQVQSVPGMNLSGAEQKVTSGELKTGGFDLIILSVGGNDLEKKTIDYIMQKYRAIIRYLQEADGIGRIAFSMIIPREGDVAFEKKRCDVNSLLKRMCKDLAIPFLQPMKGVSLDQAKGMGIYNRDNIHLNKHGVIKMIDFFKGAVAAHLINTPGQRKQEK
jgi:hypothetical protein